MEWEKWKDTEVDGANRPSIYFKVINMEKFKNDCFSFLVCQT